MSIEGNRDLLRDFFKRMNQNRRSPVELCAPGFKAQIGGNPIMDLDAFRQHQDNYFAAFSDNSTTFIDMIAEGDKVAYRAVVEGVHQAEYMGVPASGKKISVALIGMIRVADGKVAELWNSPDRLSWLQQFGALPV
ncbi:MAG: ester cyclase [Deltaproteobacteria bacterium]|nr:ester cyclase [Deltaproteobacteria bacterium]